MASSRAPNEFTFDPKDWSSWITRFSHYRQISDLKKEKEEVQVSALLYYMGPRADDIMKTFQLSEEDSKKFDKVLEKFEDHYKGKTNVVFERATFGRRNQREGESIDEFVTDLHKLSSSCEYEGLRESLIRDRLVLGVRDQTLSDKLMMTAKLTLDKAVELAKQWESVKQQQRNLSSEGMPHLDSIAKSGKRVPAGDKPSLSSRPPRPSDSIRECKFCGFAHEMKKSMCPALLKECNLCGERGHFAKKCPKNISGGGDAGIVPPDSREMDRVTFSILDDFALG